MSKIVSTNNLNGKIIRDTDVYIVEDNTDLERMVLSKTTLHPGKETGGHSHEGVEELYFINQGSGNIQLNDSVHPISNGDIIIVQDGVFHKVFNTGTEDLIFVSVFETYKR